MTRPNDQDQALLSPRPDIVSGLIGKLTQLAWRSVTVTALVLGVLWASRYVPLPFVAIEAADRPGFFGTHPQWNLALLGVLAWVQAYVVVGLVRFVYSRIRRVPQAFFDGTTPYARSVLLLTLILGGLQAWLMAQQIDVFEALTLTPWRGPIAMALLVGLALAIAAAAVIDRYGIGNGF